MKWIPWILLIWDFGWRTLALAMVGDLWQDWCGKVTFLALLNLPAAFNIFIYDIFLDWPYPVFFLPAWVIPFSVAEGEVKCVGFVL